MDNCRLDAAFPLQISGAFFRFRQAGSVLTLTPLSAMTHEVQEALLQTKVKAEQTQWITDPTEIAEQTTAFWNTFWQRDQYTLNDDLELQTELPSEYPPFEDALRITEDTLPNWDECNIIITPEHWYETIRGLPTFAAKGCDGFAKDELKLLPSCVWMCLIAMIEKFVDWPKCLVYCKTHMLPKTEKPSHPASTRPITVAAIVYRSWASIVARQLLQHWATRLPNTISGGIPGKGTSHVLVQIYHKLEEAWMHGTPLSGCVLDISF